MKTILCILLTYFAELTSAQHFLFVPQPMLYSHTRFHYDLARQMVEKGYKATVLLYDFNSVIRRLKVPEGVEIIRLQSRTDYDHILHIIDEIIYSTWETMPPHIQVAKLMPYSISYCTEPCRLLAQDNALMAKLRSSNFTFGIYDPTDACGWLLFEQLAIPYASYSGGPMLYHSDAALGSSTPFSFVPSQISSNTDRMCLLERLTNSIDHLTRSGALFYEMIAWIVWVLYWPRAVNSKPVLGLYMQSTIFDYPRPRTHGQILYTQWPDRGNNNKNSNGLDAKYEELCASASRGENNLQGTIVFTFTTMGIRKDTPAFIKEPVAETFRNLSSDYFIVWRALSKEDIEPNPPMNTYVSEWIPQVHALDNCNTKVFISHGGMNGNKEAILRGIPIITLPLTADHSFQGRKATNRGVGLVLAKVGTTKEILINAVEEVTNNPKYRQRAKHFASMLTMETEELLHTDAPLAWWLTYGERHGGKLNHWTRPIGSDFPFVMYFSLDTVISTFLSLYFTIHWLK